MALKLTPEQQAIDRELSRINRQIVQAYKVFGQSGRLTQQYETLLYTGGKGRGGSDKTAPSAYQTLVRTNKSGIPQLARSKAAIRLVQSGGAANAIMQLGRMQTVQSAKNAMIAAYEQRTGQKVRGSAARAAAVQQEVALYNETQGRLGAALAEMYRIERDRGVRLKAHEDIKAMSRGRWTSQETLKQMIQTAEQAAAAEDAEIISQYDVLAGY